MAYQKYKRICEYNKHLIISRHLGPMCYQTMVLYMTLRKAITTKLFSWVFSHVTFLPALTLPSFVISSFPALKWPLKSKCCYLPQQGRTTFVAIRHLPTCQINSV